MKKIKINKLIAGYFLCASMQVCLVGCDDNNSLHQKYIDQGETFYTGKIDSLKAYPGNERVKFTWEFNSDPRITKTVISWNDGKESADIPVSQQGTKKMETILNIPEGTYTFKLVTMDSEGHYSLGTERTFQIYGPKYASYMYSNKGRRISSFVIEGGPADPVTLVWSDADADADLVRTVLKYESASGTLLERDIPNDETTTTLPDIKATSAYSIYSYFLPAPEALDLLSSVYEGIAPSGPEIVGSWKFDDLANLSKATVGNDLIPVGTGFGPVAGPTANNRAVRVDKGAYYRMLPGMAASRGGANVNEYSLVFDVKLPATGVWHSLLQTDPNNSGDADLFIRNTNLLGVGTYFQPPLEAEVWYRVVVSAKLGEFFRIYLNGEFVGGFTSSSGIAQIDNRGSLNLAGVCLFADDNGEDADIDVAEVTLWDKALNEKLVRELGRVQ